MDEGLFTGTWGHDMAEASLEELLLIIHQFTCQGLGVRVPDGRKSLEKKGADWQRIKNKGHRKGNRKGSVVKSMEV